MKQIYGSTVISRVDWPLCPALTNNSIIIILKNTHTSKLQAGTKQRYLRGDDTRQSDDQTRNQADTNSVSCIPRVHCYLLRSRDRLRVLQYQRSNFLCHNSTTFASQPWAFCESSARRESCASVQFQIWWPGRMCFTAEWIYQISVGVECCIILSSWVAYLRRNNMWRPNTINNSFKTPGVFCIRDSLAVTWLRLSVAEGPTRWAKFHSRPVNVGSVVGKVATEHGFIQILQFCPINVIPPMLHTRVIQQLTVCNISNDNVLQNTWL